MNFRRLVSAVAALAVAGTMCAGLAVTASAADTDTVYVDENFDSYSTGTIISQGTSSAPDPVTMGLITYSASNRTSGAGADKAAIVAATEGNRLQVLEGRWASSGRGISFAFTEAAGVPSVSELDSTEALEISFDVQAENSFTVVGYGDITTTDLTTTDNVNVRIILDNATASQYFIVSDTDGNAIKMTTADLAAETFSGMSFYFNHASSYYTLYFDNIVVKSGIADLPEVDTMTFTTTPYALATINDTEYYTGDSGIITLTRPDSETTYSYTVKKGGYVTATGTATADSSTDTLATVNLALDGYLYYEDFNTVTGDGSTTESLGDASTGMFDIYAGYKTITLTADNIDLDIYNGGNGPRSVQYPLNVSTADFEFKADVTFNSTDGTQIILRDSAAQQYAAIYVDGSGNATFSAPGSTYNVYNSSIGAQTYSLGTVTLGTAVTVDVKVDNTNGIVIASIGENDPVTVTGFAKSDNRGSYANLNNFMIGSARYFTTTIDNIVVTSYSTPSITAVTSDTTIGTIAVPTTMTSVTSGDSVDYTDVVGTDDAVTTVYIKIENTTPTVAPTVTLTDDTKATAASVEYNSVGTSYYYIYQFVNMEDELDGATVTCGDLSTTIVTSTATE